MVQELNRASEGSMISNLCFLAIAAALSITDANSTQADTLRKRAEQTRTSFPDSVRRAPWERRAEEMMTPGDPGATDLDGASPSLRAEDPRARPNRASNIGAAPKANF